jgi:hypothetical protein
MYVLPVPVYLSKDITSILYSYPLDQATYIYRRNRSCQRWKRFCDVLLGRAD